MPGPSNKFIKVFFALIFLLLPVYFNKFQLRAIQRLPVTYGDFKQNRQTTAPAYVPGEIIIKFKKDKINIASNNLITIVKKFSFPLLKGLRSKSENRLGNTVVYRINGGFSVNKVVSALKQDASVEYAEPNYYRYLTSLDTNDTYATNLWGLDNTGQTITLSDGSTSTGTDGADISMPEAWDLSTGTTDIIVAVIDTGVAYTHPDLINNMWDGSNCTGTDSNGDPITGGNCLHGYDFEDNDKDPLPVSNSHGTHVAGTVAATRNNGKGIAGVGPQIKIMALKCGNPLSSDCIVSSINFARVNGAKVINASFGSPSYTIAERDAISDFQTAGGIFVAAAGNEGTDNDTSHFYPSDYDLSNIISVVAIDQGDSLASFSNFGGTSVDVAAPGTNIYSTWAESTQFEENFSGLVNGEIPAGWVRSVGSSWGVYVYGSDDNTLPVLYPDLNTPYTDNTPINTTITSNTIDLSGIANLKFDFWTRCKTENTDPTGGNSDYMVLEISSDGSSFTELSRWNTFSIGNTGFVQNYDSSFTIADSYHTVNFKFRLRWVTNGNGLYGSNGDGCLVTDFKIVKYSDGSDEKYQFENGTSMAAPHVAGLAGYLWSISPGSSATQIISNILSNGDTLATLSGKIVTGRRINAYNSVMDLGITVPADIGPTISGLTNDAVPKRTKSWTWSSDNPSTDTYRYLIDQSPSSTPGGTYDTGTTASVSSGTGTYYLHVQAKDVSSNEGTVTTVSCVLDNTGPNSTLESSTSNGFVLNFGETLYNVGSSAIENGQDMTGIFTIFPAAVGSSIIYNSNNITFTISDILAGRNVSLNTGSSATNLYDSLGNGSTSVTAVFDGSGWQLNPTTLSIGSSFIPDLFVSGVFVTTPGGNPGQSLIINNTNNLILSIGNTASSSTVNIPTNTDISELSDGEFDASLFQLTNIDPSTISNLGSDYNPEAAIQWGIVGTTLKFNNSITFNIYVGPSFEGQTLYVLRSPELNTGWTTTGIDTLSCTVTSGFCQFTATQASYYVASSSLSTPTPTPTTALTPTPTTPPSSGNNSPPVFFQENRAPQCTSTSPLSTPDLFKIITAKGSAKVFFTPVNDNITGYQIIYGFKKDDNRFGVMFNYINSNQGEQNFTIHQLNPKITYYFKVSAVNGCTSGPWSSWVPAKAGGIKTVNKYKKISSGKTSKLVENVFK